MGLCHKILWLLRPYSLKERPNRLTEENAVTVNVYMEITPLSGKYLESHH